MNKSKKKKKRKEKSKYWYLLPLYCTGVGLFIIGSFLALGTSIDIMYYSLFLIFGLGLILPKGLYDLVHESLSPANARIIALLIGFVLGVILYVIELIKRIVN